MKKFNLEEFGLDPEDGLGRNQLKSIFGGRANDEGDEGCETSCSSTHYACCNWGTFSANCVCHPNHEVHQCSSGGKGSSSCSLTPST